MAAEKQRDLNSFCEYAWMGCKSECNLAQDTQRHRQHSFVSVFVTLGVGGWA